MNKNASSQSTSSFVRFNVLIGLFAFLCTASAQAHDPRPRIAPIHTKPAGQTYGRWAAEWWQWALGVPAAVNPLIDTTGEHCAQRQVDKVWFLAGSFFSPDPVVRDCEVPAGKSLFFPLINNLSGAFLTDLPETLTEECRTRTSKLHGAGADLGMDRWFQGPQADPVLYWCLG